MENDLGKESTFNEASLKMQRIHESWRIFNTLRINLLAWNPDCSKWNYEVAISFLYNLWYETRGKCKDTEKKLFSDMRNFITDFLEQNYIYEKCYDETFAKPRIRLLLHQENWRKLRDKIFELEDFVRDMQEVHGLSTPNVDDEELWE